MNKIGTRALWILLVVAAGCAGAFAQGMYWESTVTSDKMEGSELMKTWYMPKMLKIQTGKGTDYSILRLDQEMMYLVKPDKEVYATMTFAEMEEGMKAAGAQMEKMQEQMKDMPVEQREMMEKMLGKSMEKPKAKPLLRKIPEAKMSGTFKCSRYTIMRGTDQVAEMWVTKDVKGFDAMRNDLKVFSKRMTSMNPAMGGDLAAAMENIDGFPMESTMAGIKTVITKIEPKASSPAEFQVPKDYKKVDMKDLGEAR